jgi:hypothetical protein
MPKGIYTHKPHQGFQKGHAINRGREWPEHVGFQKGNKISVGNSHGKSHIGNQNAWKGDAISYSRLHRWVAEKLGKPQFCEQCRRTKPPAGKGLSRSYFQWANVSGKYLRDVKDWRRLCIPCHMEYDRGV